MQTETLGSNQGICEHQLVSVTLTSQSSLKIIEYPTICQLCYLGFIAGEKQKGKPGSRFRNKRVRLCEFFIFRISTGNDPEQVISDLNISSEMFKVQFIACLHEMKFNIRLKLVIEF